MQEKWTWFERTFSFDFPAQKMPDIIERLRGTPIRVEDIVSSWTNEVLQWREAEDSWSIQENIGHLADVEPLWLGRGHDIAAENETMRDADLTNQPTFDANHHAKSMTEVAADFRSRRSELVRAVSRLKAKQWSMAALHPRLKTPMRIVDLCHFVAEHDDYHLARIRYLNECVRRTES